MRAVLDTNVLISAVLSMRGAPAQLPNAWYTGAFELVVSPLLLGELRRAFSYPKLSSRVLPDDAAACVAWLGRTARLAADPGRTPAVRSDDPRDDYLIALAAAERAVIASGEVHLTSLAGRIPVLRPAEFLIAIERGGETTARR